MNRQKTAMILLCYLVRDAFRSVDWEKLGGDRRANIYSELGDALLHLMVQGGQGGAVGLVGFMHALAARFEMTLHGDDRKGPLWINLPSEFVPDGVRPLPRKPWQFATFERVPWYQLAASIDYDDALSVVYSGARAMIPSFVASRVVVPREPEAPGVGASEGVLIAHEHNVQMWRDAKSEAEEIALGEVAMFMALDVDAEVEQVHWTAQMPAKMSSARMFYTIVTLKSGFAHGADMKSGNAVLFRRKTSADPSTGRVSMVPFFSAGALRGDAIRDEGAHMLCGLAGLRYDGKDAAPHRSHALFGGGTIDQGAGSVVARPLQIEQWRSICPLVDLVGGVIRDDSGKEGTQVEGMLVPRDAIVVCQENAWLLYDILAPKRDGEPMSLDEFRASLRPSRAMTEFRQATTMAHREFEDAPKRAQMIRSTEVIREGEQMVLGLTLKMPMQHVRPVTASFLTALIENLAERGLLGAQANAGFGHIAFDPMRGLDGSGLPPSSVFYDWIAQPENKAALRSFLLAGGDATPDDGHPLGPEPGSEAAKPKKGRAKKAAATTEDVEAQKGLF
jgi:hypothetical protein